MADKLEFIIDQRDEYEALVDFFDAEAIGDLRYDEEDDEKEYRLLITVTRVKDE